MPIDRGKALVAFNLARDGIAREIAAHKKSARRSQRCSDRDVYGAPYYSKHCSRAQRQNRPGNKHDGRNHVYGDEENRTPRPEVGDPIEGLLEQVLHMEVLGSGD